MSLSLPPPQIRVGFDGTLMNLTTNATGAMFSSIAVFLHLLYALRKTQNNKIRFLIVFIWLGQVIQAATMFSVESILASYGFPPSYLSLVIFASGLFTQNLPNILVLNIIASAFASIGDVLGKRLLRSGYIMTVILLFSQGVAQSYGLNLGEKIQLPGWIMLAFNNLTSIVLYTLGFKMLNAQRKLPTVRRLMQRFTIFYYFMMYSLVLSTITALGYVYMHISIPDAEFNVFTFYRMPLAMVSYLISQNGLEMILRNNLLITGNILLYDAEEIDSTNNVQITQTTKEGV